MNWKLKLSPSAGRDSARKAGVAALTTTAAIALCGQMENGDAIQPINDISHIVFGDESFAQSGASLRYTGTGLSMTKSLTASWAVLHEVLFGEYQDEGNVPVSLAGGAAVAAFAYFIDYHVVPKRLTPGFEAHLSRRSLIAIYVVMALALGLGGIKRKA
jgi:hypothetical protein